MTTYNRSITKSSHFTNTYHSYIRICK